MLVPTSCSVHMESGAKEIKPKIPVPAVLGQERESEVEIKKIDHLPSVDWVANGPCNNVQDVFVPIASESSTLTIVAITAESSTLALVAITAEPSSLTLVAITAESSSFALVAIASEPSSFTLVPVTAISPSPALVSIAPVPASLLRRPIKLRFHIVERCSLTLGFHGTLDRSLDRAHLENRLSPEDAVDGIRDGPIGATLDRRLLD